MSERPLPSSSLLLPTGRYVLATCSRNLLLGSIEKKRSSLDRLLVVGMRDLSPHRSRGQQAQAKNQDQEDISTNYDFRTRLLRSCLDSRS